MDVFVTMAAFVFMISLQAAAAAAAAAADIFPLHMKNLLRRQAVKTITKNCSIHQSAVVRQILLDDFFPIFEKYGAEVPQKCKLHKARDIFTQIEGNRSSADGISIKCEICGKEFYEVFHFYEHAKRKHSDQFLMERNSICLADYCDMFRCDLHEKYPHSIPAKIDCDDKKVARLRRRCENLMRTCLPEKMFHYIYDKLYVAVCSTLTCEKFLQPFQDSVSVLMVLFLSISAPVSIFILGQIILICCDNMDGVDDDEKYLRAQRARYEARNAHLNARFYGVRNRRHGKPFSYNKL